MRTAKCQACRRKTITNRPLTSRVLCSKCKEIDERAVREATHLEVYEDMAQSVDIRDYQEELPKRDQPVEARFKSIPEWVLELTRKIEVHLSRRRWEVVFGMLEHYRVLFSVEKNKSLDDWLEAPLNTLGLAPKVEVALVDRGVTTIRDLLNCSDGWLEEIPQFGPKALEQIHSRVGSKVIGRRMLD